MIPHTDQALRMLSQRLMTQILPDIATEYSMSDGALIGLLMNAIADEAQEGIHRRLEDIAEMRDVFAASGDLLTEKEQAAITAPLASYRLADVNQVHDALTRVLISLQVRCEQDRQANADVHAAIWKYLKHHTERHAITALP